MPDDHPADAPRFDGSELVGKRVAFLTANEGVEQVELTAPWSAVREAGGRPALIAPGPDPVQAFNHLDRADRFPVDQTTSQVDPAQFDALVLPGGVANPDQLRLDPQAVAFVRSFFANGKPVAVICHGPWTLVEADVVRGRTVTSWPSLQTDLRNAGATWVYRELVEDDGLITSRRPADLPAFCRALVKAVQAGRPAHQAPAA